MPRIRTIKPSFFTSLTIADLDVKVRLTFIGLWTHVDDDGRCVADARLVKAAVWPLDDHITAETVGGHLDELEDSGLIVRYQVAGRWYLEVCGWAEHQRINRPTPSKCPGPDEADPLEPSRTPHLILTEPSRPEGNREGNREQGREEDTSPDGDDGAPDDLDETFETFWDAYPRGRAGKPGGDGPKKPARQKWRRMTAEQRTAALQAVGHYRDHVDRPDGPIAAHATTWLNQERWEQWSEPADPRAGPQLSTVAVDRHQTGTF